jgi:hypothetical protein
MFLNVLRPTGVCQLIPDEFQETPVSFWFLEVIVCIAISAPLLGIECALARMTPAPDVRVVSRTSIFSGVRIAR